jgi:hypothetical protein
MPLALLFPVLAPVAAQAAASCPIPQAQLVAWAGSARTLTLSASCMPGTGGIHYAIAQKGGHGTATAPDPVTRKFVFTADFNPSAPDYVGPDQITVTATDDTPDPGVDFVVPIKIVAAPDLNGGIDAASLITDNSVPDTTAFDVFYKDPTSLSATLTDSQPPAGPLAGFGVRFDGIPKGPRTVTTDAKGNAELVIRPLVSDLLVFDVPTLRGVIPTAAILFVAPDWSVPKKVPIRRGKFVISGRLLAEKSARKGGSVRFQRRRGTKWVTVTRSVRLSSTLRFTVKLSTRFSGKRVRLVYRPKKGSEYITSTYTFTPKKQRLAGRLVVVGVRLHH